MIRLVKVLALCLAFLCLPSCAGYKLGGVKPAAMAGVKTVSVSMFSNSTLHPRAEALATSAVANAIVQDGTYRIAKADKADAILQGDLAQIAYSMLRASPYDTLRPVELINMVTLNWTLRDARDPTKVIVTGTSTGRSQLTVSSNLQTARNNALPEALDRAGEAIVSQIANGY